MIQRCDSSRYQPGCRSHSRRASLLSRSSESGPTATKCVQVAVVTTWSESPARQLRSAPCCLRRSGAAYPGRARHGGFIQVVWSPTGRVAGPGSPVSGSLRRRSRQLQVRGRRSFQVASFSRIRLVAESLALRRGRPLTTRSSGPLPQRPCFARLPRAPGSGLPERY